MASKHFATAGFFISAFFWLASFLAAFVLSDRRFLPWLMWIDLGLIMWAVICVLRNVFKRLFVKPFFSIHARPGHVIAAIFLNFVVFQICCLRIYFEADGFAWFYKYILVILLSNLVLLWVLICGIVGQGNFNPFFVDLMARPFFALGFLFSGGYDKKS